MKICPKCNNTISDYALSCPYCNNNDFENAQQEKKVTSNYKLLIASLLIIPALILIIVMIFLLSNGDTKNDKYYSSIPQVSKVEEYNSLKDNTSDKTYNSNSGSTQTETDIPKDKYSSLTNSEKKAICEYIEDRYDYY